MRTAHPCSQKAYDSVQSPMWSVALTHGMWGMLGACRYAHYRLFGGFVGAGPFFCGANFGPRWGRGCVAQPVHHAKKVSDVISALPLSLLFASVVR